MKIDIRHPRFVRRRLALQGPTGLLSYLLTIDGERVRKDDGQLVVTDDAGARAVVRVRVNAIAQPRVQIDGEDVYVEPPLSTAETFAAMVSLPTLAAGGLLGIAVATALIAGSARVLQRRHLGRLRYGIAVTASLAGSVGFYLTMYFIDIGRPIKQDFLVQTARAENKTAPVAIADHLRFDHATAVDGGLVYALTLTDPTALDAAQQRATLVRVACSTAEAQRILHAGFYLEYQYNDDAGVRLASHRIQQADCPR